MGVGGAQLFTACTVLSLLARQQAARFADPLEVCLSGDDDLSGRLGPFTCVADAVFFLWALAVALDCPDLLVIDVGSPSPRMSGMDPQGKELSLPGTLHIQVWKQH